MKKIFGILLAGLIISSPVTAKENYNIKNPVLAGDFADPSVIKVGSDYWATATSSEWSPEFLLLHSKNMQNWTAKSAVFEKRPDWSTGNFWAPEISQYKGKYFVYYTAHKKDGPLCIAVASANKPDGKYTDHGPMVCQDVGSIDAMTVTSENGERYLVWKEDGNSKNLPTPIWAQKLSADSTKLIGQAKEILRNDKTWEANLVEAPFIMKKGKWFYMFYSGNACCGTGCNYALGVARSQKILGPWEKNPANPILASNDTWKCPGHGSIVKDKKGNDYLLYHAYNTKSNVYVGRQGLVDKVDWTKDGWATINGGKGAANNTFKNTYSTNLSDNFDKKNISLAWQYPQYNKPQVQIKNAKLHIKALNSANVIDGIAAKSTVTGDYTAYVKVENVSDSFSGLSAYGDNENAIGIGLKGDQIVLWQREKNNHKELKSMKIDNKNSKNVYLRMMAKKGYIFNFAYSTDNKNWQSMNQEIEGKFLPPWDRGVRVALTTNKEAKFDDFKLISTY